MSIETQEYEQGTEISPMLLIPSPATLAGPRFEMDDEDITRTVAQLGFAVPGAPTQEQLAATTHDESGVAVDSLRAMQLTARASLEKNKRILDAIHRYDETRLERLIETAVEISTKMDLLLGQRVPVQTELDVAGSQHSNSHSQHEQLVGGMGALEQMKADAKARHDELFDHLITQTSELKYNQGHVEGTAAAKYKAGPTEEEYNTMMLQGEYGVASGYDFTNYQRTFVETNSSRQKKAERDAEITQARLELEQLLPHISEIDNSMGAQQLSIQQTQDRLDDLDRIMSECREGLEPLDSQIKLLHTRLEGLKLNIFELYAEFRDRDSPLKVLHALVRAKDGDVTLTQLVPNADSHFAITPGESTPQAAEPEGEVLSDTTIQAATRLPLPAQAVSKRRAEVSPEPPVAKNLGQTILNGLRNLKKRGEEG